MEGWKDGQREAGNVGAGPPRIVCLPWEGRPPCRPIFYLLLELTQIPKLEPQIPPISQIPRDRRLPAPD